NYAVDGPFYLDASGNGGFNAALFDARGFYVSDGGSPPMYSLITGRMPVPTGFYCTRISSKLDWIHSVIDPTGDFDGNGISNLLQYAISLNTAATEPTRSVQTEKGFQYAILIYRKITDAKDLQY